MKLSVTVNIHVINYFRKLFKIMKTTYEHVYNVK